jgi:hypothetical protein
MRPVGSEAPLARSPAEGEHGRWLSARWTSRLIVAQRPCLMGGGGGSRIVVVKPSATASLRSGLYIKA